MFEGLPIDAVAVPAIGREKRVLVSDLDSTMITVECIDELADLVGLKAEVARITQRAMNGELVFEAALRERVALLAGLPEAVFEQVWQQRIRLMPGAIQLVRTLRARGATTALVSGGFVPFAERARAAIGFDHAFANQLEVEGGQLTGRLLEPIRGPADKLAVLNQLAAEAGLPMSATLAVGDGANDLPMLEAAGLGVAFRGHPNVAGRAPVSIRHGDLTALLFLQGIARSEFAAAPT
jgi:phosphoserine phosphatase